MSRIVDDIVALLTTKGARQYGGEPVSQLAHALQCATLAEASGAPSPLIAAALLHDVGHLLDDGDEGLARDGLDARHEAIGYSYLSTLFVDAVSLPVALHVDAKRYLCAIDDSYWATLSPASQHSLELQGGIFDIDAAVAFERQGHAEDAAALRRWDDLAKDSRAETPGPTHFRPHLEASLRAL